MGTSLGFHIVFAVLGVGLPLLMFVAEGLWLWRRDPGWLELARRWSKAFGILFAVGAVSGTALSFELGLLWPGFMAFSGSIIGLPFSAEGFAFFLEAVFLGLYLYGWDRLSPVAHWLTSIPIAVSGAASSLFVVMANAWMNSPAGFHLDAAGKLPKVDLTRLTSAEVRGHLRAAAESAGGHIAEAFPWITEQARILAIAGVCAMLAVAAALIAPAAVERALARRDVGAVSREVQGMRAGPRRTYYEGRLQEERKEYEGAARSFETAARAGERRAFERLLEMAQSGPCEARVGAARALGRLGDQDAVKVLESMEKEAREGPQQGLLAHVMGCNSRVAAHDALEQIRGAP